MHRKAVVFGEMLWDCFPDKKLPGGAPMNVALHLQNLGMWTSFISAVGEDPLGKELVEFMERKNLSPAFVQSKPLNKTGQVLVNDMDRENIRYDIMEPVAWDYIEWQKNIQDEGDRADCFIFGSLAARNQVSRDTLTRLLETPALKVFDINLRLPYYGEDTIKALLYLTDVLKINEEELEVLANMHGCLPKPSFVCKKLLDTYKLKVVCMTRGAYGALMFDGREFWSHPGYKVDVVDTVGSGDAFLSGFVYKYLQRSPAEDILEFACALGALVAGREGGTPGYRVADVEGLKKGWTADSTDAAD
ncbi:carbohydrate kinase family protein [Negadavirga shengliensis]|uniref:Carbohydrate kinase n=1 Tax=Negadavirga shengliensis TaxID=1389218 RepID=A0ABV9SVB8_9BACT